LNETSLKCFWNAGMLEYWNTGYQNDQNIIFKLNIFRFLPIIPFFQNSIIPVK